MTKEICEYCKKDLEMTNPKFILILKELTTLGYSPLDFCNSDCLIRYIAKKFKRKIMRMK